MDIKIKRTMDLELLNQLSKIAKFNFVTENDKCTELSFFNNDYLFGGLIRHNQNKIKILEILSKFENLKSLNLRKCKIGKLDNINSFNLEYLDISCNDLYHIPNFIYSCKNIRHLNIGSNNISFIDDKIFDLNLETLKLHKNSITHLPILKDTIINLNLYFNKLKEIPNIIFKLNKLQVFSFGGTEITNIPEDICNLIDLKYLCLVANHISNIPNSLCNLHNLKGILLSKNKIFKLPLNIGNLNIEDITLYSNNIGYIPKSFYNLKLNKLNLSKNKLSSKDKLKIYKHFNNIKLLKI